MAWHGMCSNKPKFIGKPLDKMECSDKIVPRVYMSKDNFRMELILKSVEEPHPKPMVETEKARHTSMGSCTGASRRMCHAGLRVGGNKAQHGKVDGHVGQGPCVPVGGITHVVSRRARHGCTSKGRLLMTGLISKTKNKKKHNRQKIIGVIVLALKDLSNNE